MTFSPENHVFNPEKKPRSAKIRKSRIFSKKKKKKNPAAWGGYTEYYSSYLSVFLMLMYLEQNLKTRVSNYPQLERQENKLGNGFV